MSSRFAVAAVLAVVVLTSGSVATVAAADRAKPGDALFPLDIATERIILAFVTGDREDGLRVRFARERLDEVRAILALADVNGLADSTSMSATSTDDTSTSTNGTSTSTDDTTTSTDDTSTSTDGTSTSTDDTTTSTDDTDTSTDDTGDIDPTDIERAQFALNLALEYLEQTRDALESDGKDSVALIIDGIIDELTSLAEDHIAELDRFEAKIKDDGEHLKVDIRASSDEIKTRFKLDQKTDGDGEDETRIRLRDNDSDTKLKVDDDGFKFKFKWWGGGDNNGDDRHHENGKEDDHMDDGHHEDDKDHADEDHDDGGEHGDEDEDEDDNEDEDEDDNGGGADVTAPVIFGLAATPGTSTADIDWDTDEDSDSELWYGASSPVSTAGAPGASSGALVTSHSLTLSGLTASTTYYYVVGSTDGSGNAATSSEMSFTTLEGATSTLDTTPPVISGISSVAGTSTADIDWDTDEDADSKAWYSTSTPVDISGTPGESSASPVTAHSLTLSGLTASTTYYYIVGSEDGLGNAATSTEFSFTTL